MITATIMSVIDIQTSEHGYLLRNVRAAPIRWRPDTVAS
jgi:hypothetical protein